MKYLLLLIISVNFAFSQYSIKSIDTVYNFTPGEGQNFGQSNEYYPQNIFGFPDTNATIQVPSANEYQILSLGFGGEIVLGIKNTKIINGNGIDFTIFENVFLNPALTKYFVEPAKVAVSQDGINFIEFPFDSTTLIGCAGTLPTQGKVNPFIPENCGGNVFDLNDLNLDYITYIKITDISKMVFDNPTHQYYDVTISGFDLDAVVAWFTEDINSSVGELNFSNSIKVYSDYIEILAKINEFSSVCIYNLLGNIVLNERNSSRIINISNLASGVYFLKINDEYYKFLKE